MRETYAVRALPVLIILAIAQAIRLAGAPYCMMLVSTGEQTKGIASGMAEAGVNLTATLWLGHSMGYVGVAWGTLIGAVADMIALICYTVPRTQLIPFPRWRLIESSLLRPLICLTPLGIFMLAYLAKGEGREAAWLILGPLASGLLIWRLREI